MNNLTFIILFIATLILLVAYVVFVAIYNHQMLRKHSIQLQEAYRQTQTKELSAQEKTLNDLIAQCAVIHKQIFDNKSKNIDKSQAIFDAYYKFFNLQSDKLFFHFIDTNLYQFASRLKNQYEELTIKEQKFVIFYLLKLNETDIADLLNYSITSLPTIKNRICKKVHIKHASDLYDSLLLFLKTQC